MLTRIWDFISDAFSDLFFRFDFNWPLILTTLGTSLVAGGLNYYLYTKLLDSVPRVLLIGLLFAIFFVAQAGAVVVVSFLTDAYSDDIIDNRLINMLVVFAGGTIGAFLLGMLFQFLYGLHSVEYYRGPADTYIFMVDNSGSMSSNDENGLRYEAIRSIISSLPDDNYYAIYGFDSTIEEMIPLKSVSSGVKDLTWNDEGGTAIFTMLQAGLQEYESGRWGTNSHPRVILLTDGHANDIQMFGKLSQVRKVTREYARAGIVVSTVGFGHADGALLQAIADGSGGVYIDAQDVSRLLPALEQAGTRFTEAERDLLNFRIYMDNDWLYAILRILFLAILGCGLAVITTLAYQSDDAKLPIIIQRCVMSLIGAILLEILVQETMLTVSVNALFWFLFGFTVLAEPRSTSSSMPFEQDYYSGFGSSPIKEL